MFKKMNLSILCAVFLRISTTDIQATSFDHLTKEKDRVDFQISRYDVLYQTNSITCVEDLTNKVIQEYIPVAQDGIHYVRDHFTKKDVARLDRLSQENIDYIINECNFLETQLHSLISMRHGMTVVQFMAFNFKLGDIQNPHNHLSEDSMPFYEMDYSYLNHKYEMQITNNVLIFNPYIIYTPNGGFSVNRIMSNILLREKPVSLQALIIGEFSVDEGPHYDGFLTAVDFLGHDFQHNEFVIQRQASIIKLKELEKKGLNLNDPIIMHIAFHDIHEQLVYECEDILLSDKRYTDEAFLEYMPVKLKKNEEGKYINYTGLEAQFENTQAITMMLAALCENSCMGNVLTTVQKKHQREFFLNTLDAEFEEKYSAIRAESPVAFEHFLRLKIREAAKEKVEFL